VQAVIVGGGYIGLETAAGLSMNGLDVRPSTSCFDGEEVMEVDHNTGVSTSSARPVVSQKHDHGRRAVPHAICYVACKTLLL